MNLIKKMFLRNLHRKTEVSMPGLRPYVEQLRLDVDRGVTPRYITERRAESSLMSPSAQSFLSRTGTKPDPVPNRRPQPFSRLVQTAHIRRPEPVIAPPSETTISPLPAQTTTTTTNPRPPTGRHISRERLNRLAQPKGLRYKSAPLKQSTLNRADGSPTAEEALAQVEQQSQAASTANNLPEKPKTAISDKRFQHLMNVFSEVYSSNSSEIHSCKQIVAANPSLQDDEGLWKSDHPSVSSQKAELKQYRQMLAEKLNHKVDVFLIEVGA